MSGPVGTGNSGWPTKHLHKLLPTDSYRCASCADSSNGLSQSVTTDSADGWLPGVVSLGLPTIRNVDWNFLYSLTLNLDATINAAVTAAGLPSTTLEYVPPNFRVCKCKCV